MNCVVHSLSLGLGVMVTCVDGRRLRYLVGDGDAGAFSECLCPCIYTDIGEARMK